MKAKISGIPFDETTKIYAVVGVPLSFCVAPATPTATDVPTYYTFRFIYQPGGSKSF